MRTPGPAPQLTSGMTIAIVGVLAAQDGVLWSTGTHTLRGTAPGCAFFLRESESDHRVAHASGEPNIFASGAASSSSTAVSCCAGLADHVAKPPDASGCSSSPSPSFARASAPPAGGVQNRPLRALRERLASSLCWLAALQRGADLAPHTTGRPARIFGRFDGTSMAPRRAAARFCAMLGVCRRFGRMPRCHAVPIIYVKNRFGLLCSTGMKAAGPLSP